MKRQHIILILLSLVAAQGVTTGEGFPKQVKKQIEERFKGPKGSRTFFVVLKPGIKATGILLTGGLPPPCHYHY